ncbi:MAG TPA: class I SAM-dependent methyltransferase [Candidatus Binataceae bacterium]|nr:class I SAM-dependent methyltransferase [Candidatus Binataceae bacterium]
MFTKSTAFYDAIYSFKNYEKETQRLVELIRERKRAPGVQLLDVACGTGSHAGFLRQHYEVQGLDLDQNMLEIARARFPEIRFHHGNMLDFDLGRTFDVVACLFSSIGYLKSSTELERTIENFARHLSPGGVVIVEPWLRRENFREGVISGLFVDRPDLKIARMARGWLEGAVSRFIFHYMVGTADGIDYFTETHDLTMFSREQYLAAFEMAGLSTAWDEPGLMGRGLVIGTKPR